jgi:hypothetical protein
MIVFFMNTYKEFVNHGRSLKYIYSQIKHYTTSFAYCITSFISPDIENSDKSTLQLLVNLLTKVNIFIHLKCRKTLL